MRSILLRLAAVVAGVVIVASCDTRFPTAGLSASTSTLSHAKPAIAISAPATGTNVLVGDSILVTAELRGSNSLKTASIVGMTEKGSVALGTFTQTPRYPAIVIPATGVFRPGLHDTTISRYLQPALPVDTTVDSLVVLVATTDSTGLTDTAQVRINLVRPQLSLVTPTVSIDSPLVGTLVNVGDSILVTVHLHDPQALASATMLGVTQSGDVDLGTFAEKPRYKQVSIPVTGQFRPGLRDTVVRRYLQPIDPTDTTLDSLIIRVAATDTLKLADTAQVRVDLVAGPKVRITAPVTGDSIPPGAGVSVSANAISDIGVGRVDIRVQGESNWPTRLDTTVTQVYTGNPRDVTFTSVVRVPANAPILGKVTITASAIDANRQPGSASPVVAHIRAAPVVHPRVTQTVTARSEYLDSVNVRATGDGIAMLGLIIRDSTGTIIQSDTVKLPAPYNANVQQNVPLNLPSTEQGKRLFITAFAIDQSGLIGYAVPTAQQAPTSDLASALADSTLVVYGRTYTLPQSGTIGDVAIDPARGNVFLSNTAFNLLDVWQTSPTHKGFATSTVSVGSLPWGLFVSNNPDTLLVANSGGTNISRVFIGSSDATTMHEDLANRILTRNTYLYVVTESRDENTGKIRLSAEGPISYSDRPQYLVQSKGGRIFYSTRPTTTNPNGTIRWLDPSLPVPDPEQIWQYGKFLTGTTQSYALFNVDSILIDAAPAGSAASDVLEVWDHPYGQASGVIHEADSDPEVVVAALQKDGSDAELVLRLDVSSLPLTDTTFAAASGDRTWVGFGEGHTSGAGRIIMVNDPSGTKPTSFSPLVTISDLTDNASEPVFGLAIDSTGTTVAAHGNQSYFAAITDPFHLRLQGTYDSPNDGAGIAFHPAANGTLTPSAQRLAFAAEASGSIEAIDAAYYVNRGTYPLRDPIYGPLRASPPMPGDPPNVVLKLFALSQRGLVVIDLTAADIKPAP